MIAVWVSVFALKITHAQLVVQCIYATAVFGNEGPAFTYLLTGVFYGPKSFYSEVVTQSASKQVVNSSDRHISNENHQLTVTINWFACTLSVERTAVQSAPSAAAQKYHNHEWSTAINHLK